MNAAQNFHKIHMKACEIFKTQDQDAGDFDVTIEIDGQKLYANKFMLCSASETFKTMLSNRWNKTNDSIKIPNYSFNDFKEFLIFIYSGECELTNDNVFNMVDISEFYGIEVLKTVCEDFLLNFQLNLENIFQICDFADKYSMIQLQQLVDEFLWKNFSSILKSEYFQSLPKTAVKSFVEATHKTSRQEELFEGLYSWAEERAIENQNSNHNEAIKKELIDVLPFIKFQIMEKEFIEKFIVGKSFLFSNKQMNSFLENQRKVLVKVVNGDEKLMKGVLCCPDIDKVMDDIKSVENKYAYIVDKVYGYWPKRGEKPLDPSKIIINEKCDWYLIYAVTGNIAVKHRNEIITGNYLLAEMFAENEFEFSGLCYIDIFA